MFHGTQSHTSNTPYSAASRPNRPSLTSSRPGRSSSVPSHSQTQPTASSSKPSHKSGRRDGNSGRRDGGASTSTGGSGGGDGGKHVKTLKEWIGTRKRGPGLIDLSVSFQIRSASKGIPCVKSRSETHAVISTCVCRPWRTTRCC
jgi:hypothetical protein